MVGKPLRQPLSETAQCGHRVAARGQYPRWKYDFKSRTSHRCRNRRRWRCRLSCHPSVDGHRLIADRSRIDEWFDLVGDP